MIDRIVDAHIHLWDRSRTDWYPYLGEHDPHAGQGRPGMHRTYTLDDYLLDTAAWNVDKIVHVAAARAPFEVAETLELDELATRTGYPSAIVGSVGVHNEVSVSMARLEDMSASPRFRGIRATGDQTGVPAVEVLEALVESDLVLDLFAKGDRLTAAAEALDRWTELTIVVEHAGWPTGGSDLEFARWKTDIAALARISGNVHCKISGLAMPLHTMEVSVLRPWVENCLEVFGVDRCLFASNFPVDSAFGTYDDLYSSFDAICEGMTAEERDKLFAANAERLYRC